MPAIAFISDAHIGPTGFFKGIRRKLTEFAEPYLKEFAQHVAHTGRYNAVLQLGDLIEDESPERDRANFSTGVRLLAACGVPAHHVIGNHDTARLSAGELLTLLNRPSHFYSFDVAGAHIVVLHTIQREGRIVLPEEQVTWLRDDLAGTSLPTLICSHHSFADQDLQGNPWFEGAPNSCLVDNRGEVRAILRDAGGVVAVVNGHLHWNHVDWHDGIPYITVQSAVENCDDAGTPAHAWGEIEITANQFTLRQFGNTPFEVNSAINL
jgi:3',5'-cyclic AMP phosphodiesterase CpdA